MDHNEQKNIDEIQDSASIIEAQDSINLLLDDVSIDIRIKVWDIYTCAPEWFADALSEAQNGQSHHARCREILFAVCFAESYLFEWVRDEVLKGHLLQLNNYFKPGVWQRVLDKWKAVPKKLAREKLISAAPNLGETYWQEFCTLVDYRNGLAHARASRPETSSQPENEKPIPSKIILDQLPPGWAVRVVVTLVQRLHDAAGTPPPTWLVNP